MKKPESLQEARLLLMRSDREEVAAILRQREEYRTKAAHLQARVEELERALKNIAEKDELVEASGGAWAKQALGHRQDIARKALATEEAQGDA